MSGTGFNGANQPWHGQNGTSFPSMAQFRTTQRLEGEYVMGAEDADKRFEDSVGCVGDSLKAGPACSIKSPTGPCIQAKSLMYSPQGGISLRPVMPGRLPG
jgi:hypothetical protein